MDDLLAYKHKDPLMNPPENLFRSNRGVPLRNNLLMPASWPVGESTADLDALASYLAGVFTSMIPPSNPQSLVLRCIPQDLAGKETVLVLLPNEYKPVFWRRDNVVMMEMLPLVLSQLLCEHLGGSSVPLHSVQLECVDLGFRHLRGSSLTRKLNLDRTFDEYLLRAVAEWRFDQRPYFDFTTPYSDLKEREDFQDIWERQELYMERQSVFAIYDFLHPRAYGNYPFKELHRWQEWRRVQRQGTY